MGDEERTKKKTDPREDLDRYIDEIKRKGEPLNDDHLQRLLFSPGGSAVMENQRKEEEGAFEEDFSDALEFIREDLKYSKGSKAEEVFVDARSHFDRSSLSSPPVNVSPSRASIDPLSPSTSFALDKMSRVSLYSPAALPHGFLPPNGQGHPSPSHPSIRPLPPQLHPSLNHPPHPPHPPPLPNGNYHSNGTPVPYPPTMAPTPFIPQSMPLPPTVIPKGAATPRNGHAITTTSTVNPLFNPYAHPPSSISYPIHPHAPPFPSIAYPPGVPRIPQQQKVAEKQRDQAELARFLAQQEQMTTRMISQCSKQMHFPPHHLQHLQQPPRRPPQQVQQRSMQPPLPPPSMVSPSAPSSDVVEWFIPANLPDHVSPELYVLAFEHAPVRSEIFRPGYEQAKEIVKEKARRRTAGEKELVVILRHHPHLTANLPRDLTTEEYEKARKEYKRGKALLKKDKEKKEKKEEESEDEEGDESAPRPPRPRKKKKSKCNDAFSIGQHLHGMSEEELEKFMKKRRNEVLKTRLLSKYGTFIEDAEGNVLPPEDGSRLVTFDGDPRFPLPPGKDMSFYIRPADTPPSPRSPCPSPTVVSLQYVEEVPQCKEGRDKPLLYRGYYYTKERNENPDLFGGKYLQKIQSLFHSVTGDPSRVPNASTKGEKWEYPFKEGEEPIGMEVHRNVRGRVWNPDYDYSPILQQLIDEVEDRLVSELSSRESKKTKDSKNNLSRAEEVSLRGNVVSIYPGPGEDTDSDVSDASGDGRIAVGREALKREEERRREHAKELEEEEKAKSERRRVLVRDETRKIHCGYFPLLMAERFWGKIDYYEREVQVGDAYLCKWNIPTVFVDPQIHENTDSKPERFSLAAFDRVGRDDKTTKVLLQQDQTFYFKTSPGGYVILGSESEPPLFVQSPFYNAMMGEKLDTVIRITKGHEMVVFDENFFNLLLQQAYQHGDRVVYEMRQLLLTRVSCTKGWGEAYQKQTILDALVWIEMSLLNPVKKIDTLLRGVNSVSKKKSSSQRKTRRGNCHDQIENSQSSQNNNAPKVS